MIGAQRSPLSATGPVIHLPCPNSRKKFDSTRLYRELGCALRLARFAAGKTQTDVADQITVSFQQLQKYQNGTNGIAIEQLLALAEYFDVSLNTLLSLWMTIAGWHCFAENLQPAASMRSSKPGLTSMTCGRHPQRCQMGGNPERGTWKTSRYCCFFVHILQVHLFCHRYVT